MPNILFEYEMNPTTWVYLSSLMIIGIYFKFHRFWSVRNLDLLGLIALAPGLLLRSHGLAMIAAGLDQQGHALEQLGYIWLFSVGGFFLLRLLLDPLMVRRPLLEPNLSAGGLTFTGVALLAFLDSHHPHPTADPQRGGGGPAGGPGDCGAGVAGRASRGGRRPAPVIRCFNTSPAYSGKKS